MIDKKSILKMSKHVFRKSQGYPDRRLMHPGREWLVGIVAFSFVVIVGSAFAGNLFIKYKNIDSVTGDSGERIPVYKEKVAQDALIEYQKREDAYHAMVLEDVSEASVSIEENVFENNTGTSTYKEQISPAKSTTTPEVSTTTNENLGEIELSF
jgi:hypothetical protein